MRIGSFAQIKNDCKINQLPKGRIKSQMQKSKQLKETIKTTDFKMPSINDLRFPKMKSHLSRNQAKHLKSLESVHQNQSPSEVDSTDKNLVRNYSMSLTSFKIDLKFTNFPKKNKIYNTNPEKINYLKVEKCQILSMPNLKQTSSFPFKYALSVEKFKDQQSTLPSILVLSNRTEKQTELKLRNSMYPAVKFQAPEYSQKRNNFLTKIMPGQSPNALEQIFSAKISRKKVLFNGKILVNKKQKNELPDELVTRKLIWDGRLIKKIDHKGIYKDILLKFKNQQNQKNQQVDQSQTSHDKLLERMRLSAWEQNDERNQESRQQSQNQKDYK